jgi:ring-1,2-phenylacetyl-CoA epoxidase subunit PaaD
MKTEVKHSSKEISEILSQIPDPEIPVINIADLGILRNVEVKDDSVIVDITPTYSGCPAMKMIEDQIREELHKAGIENIIVNHILSPAWTTDWMNDDAKEKLKKFGIAPPTQRKVKCPHCNSENVEVVSQFGSTACKALYKCNDCKEPFDFFKCH